MPTKKYINIYIMKNSYIWGFIYLGRLFCGGVLFVFSFLVPGMDPRILHKLSLHCTTELHPMEYF
jgi:hypothetical protein